MSKSLGATVMSSVPSNLLAGSHPPVTIPITLVSGQNLVTGTVLGRITASGKLSAYDAGNSPAGVGTACLILGQDTDASAGDEKTFAIAHGEVPLAALTGLTAAATLSLLSVGIYVK